jgi:CSLREA domain-containing protein
VVRRALAALGAAVAACVCAPAAGAETIAPTTTADELNGAAPCSLREALSSANADAPVGGCPAGSGTDSIPLAPGTYSLTLPGGDALNAEGDLDVLAGSFVQISAAATAPTVIEGGDDRVLEVHGPGANATLTGLTIRGGSSAVAGGGIRNEAALVIFNSTLTDNFAATFGGGVSTDGGGAVTNLTNVTVSGNRANGDGGGLDNAGGTTNLNNVTVAANSADRDASGAGDGGGVNRFTGTLSTANSLIAGNVDGTPAGVSAPDCRGTITSLGRNLLGNPRECLFSQGVGDIVGTSAPGLGPLADNGGPTPTHALTAESPAIDAALAGAAESDQRFLKRTRADIGAYERVLCGGAPVNRIGTAAPDTLLGTGGRDGFLGLGGRDKVRGLGGRDGLCGGSGNDILRGGGARDTLLGQAGRDVLAGGRGRDSCRGGGGRDTTRSC